MLTARHTKNMTGLLLSGDPEDFEQLYDALHNIVGTEEDSKHLYDERIRVLGLAMICATHEWAIATQHLKSTD